MYHLSLPTPNLANDQPPKYSKVVLYPAACRKELDLNPLRIPPRIPPHIHPCATAVQATTPCHKAGGLEQGASPNKRRRCSLSPPAVRRHCHWPTALLPQPAVARTHRPVQVGASSIHMWPRKRPAWRSGHNMPKCRTGPTPTFKCRHATLQMALLLMHALAQIMLSNNATANRRQAPSQHWAVVRGSSTGL